MPAAPVSRVFVLLELTLAATAAPASTPPEPRAASRGRCNEGQEELSILQTRHGGAGLRTSEPTGSALDSLNSRLTYACNVHWVNKSDWLSQCAYFMKVGGFKNDPKYSSYYLKEKDSGLCTVYMSAAFLDMQYNSSVQQVLEDHDLLNTRYEEVADQLPETALPLLMSFPHTAHDVVELVKFAKKYSIPVSVKNSGHSYSGQSTRRGSLQLNMRHYPVYSRKQAYRCDEVEAGSPAEAPCKLAMARGKGAVIRVGGGEGNDEVLRNLASWNYALPANKTYQALTGAEGMVGAGGGWVLGGGLGSGQSRMWGVGSDNVVEVEMVLPDGVHVKFGPTEWERKEGHMYPQTTKVEGQCNKNSQHMESKWHWGPCHEDINFADLWFAVRGGGGGTWGVLLSVYYQLHEWSPWTFVGTNFEAVIALIEVFQPSSEVELELLYADVRKMWTDFLIEFLWRPSVLGVSPEVSNSCGYTGTNTNTKSPYDMFGRSIDITLQNYLITCWAPGADEALISAWKAYVPTSTYLLRGNVTGEIQNLLTSCMLPGGGLGQFMVGVTAGGGLCFNEGMKLTPEVAQLPRKEQTAKLLETFQRAFFRSPLGQLLDSDGPQTQIGYQWAALFPISMITEYDRDWVIDFLLSLESHHCLGGRLRDASDGMTVQPKGYREAALEVQLGTSYNMSEISGLILQFLGAEDQNSTDGFPGYTELNHQSGIYAGPLKSDWRTACPLDATEEQRRAQCMSVQETMFGSRNLERLEDIKKKLDPDNLFSVHFGVGNRDVISAVPQD